MSEIFDRAIDVLVRAGWTVPQARALLRALRTDTSAALPNLATLWIEHCCTVRLCADLLDLVALGGALTVTHDGDDWAFSRAPEGLTVTPAVQAGLTD